MPIVRFREDEILPLSEESMAELRALAERLDDEIDYSDIPEAKDFSSWLTVEELERYLAEKKGQAATV